MSELIRTILVMSVWNVFLADMAKTHNSNARYEEYYIKDCF